MAITEYLRSYFPKKQSMEIMKILSSLIHILILFIYSIVC